MSQTSLSVSIVVYDLDRTIFNQCFDSLIRALNFCVTGEHLDDYAITIVDNGDNRKGLSETNIASAEYVQSEANVGFGIAHNRVIHNSNANYHLVLNPDLILEENSIARFIQIAKSSSDIVLIGPMGRALDGHNAYLAKRYPALLDLMLRGFAPAFVKRFFDKRLAHYEYHEIQGLVDSGCTDVQLISGCCMFLRTDVAQSQGGFDERFFLYFEDFDFCLNMKKAGRVVYAPSVQVTHYGGNSARKGINHIALFCRSAWKFYRKNGWKLI